MDEVVAIAISDTGKGIPSENIEKIFDPFFTTRESGTGLGLAISHGIIEGHGGSIDVKSKPGNGTTFSIRLSSKSMV
jgi:signal transduction histidine kinase